MAEGFKVPNIQIKHKFYEVVAPITGKKLQIKGLSNSDLLTLANSNVTDTTSKLNIGINVLYSAILNKDAYNNSFDYFVTHADYDNDLMAIIIGALIETYGESEKLEFTMPCKECGSDVKFSIPYARIVSKFNPNQEPDSEKIFETEKWVDYEDLGISLLLRYPSIQSHIGSIALIEQINNNDKVFDILKIPEIKRQPILVDLAYLKYVKGIKSLETGDEVLVDYEKMAVDTDFLISATYVASLLGEFPSDTLADIPKQVNPQEYGIECIHVKKCKSCGIENSVDLKPSLQEIIIP